MVSATVTAPEMIGLLAWWSVVLAAPVVLVRCTRAAASPDARPGRVNPGRLSSETLEPLCRYVDFRRRLELAARELAAQLVQLPAARWRIEPYPLTGERRNTFVIIGETGIFVTSATYAPGHWDDVVAASRLASKIQDLLPGYDGPVQPAICHPVHIDQTPDVASGRRTRRLGRRLAARGRLRDRVAHALRLAARTERRRSRAL